MKAKLGGTKKVKKLKYQGYKALLKKSLKKIVESGKNEKMQFAIVKGDDLPWKDGSGEDKPLLYIGDIKDWKKDVKSLKLDMKGFAYGECQVSRKGDKVEIKLAPQKGKLAAQANLKPLKKLFATKFKPKVLLETVAKLEEQTAAASAASAASETTATTGEEESTDFNFKGVAKELIDKFKNIQKEFDRDTADEINDNIKEWIGNYKQADANVKKSVKDAGKTIQKVAAHVKKVLKVDNVIEKTLDPLYKDIDKYNNMVDHSVDEAKNLKDNITKVFDDLEKKAASIKDKGLVDVLKNYRKEIKD